MKCYLQIIKKIVKAQKIYTTITSQNNVFSLTNRKHSLLQRKPIHHYELIFCDFKRFLSIDNISFYWNRSNPSNSKERSYTQMTPENKSKTFHN